MVLEAFQPDSFDDSEIPVVVCVAAVLESMNAQLSWMRVRQLTEQLDQLKGQPQIEDTPSNRNESFGVDLLRRRKGCFESVDTDK